MTTPEQLKRPVSDCLEEGGFTEEAAFYRRVAEIQKEIIFALVYGHTGQLTKYKTTNPEFQLAKRWLHSSGITHWVKPNPRGNIRRLELTPEYLASYKVPSTQSGE